MRAGISLEFILTVGRGGPSDTYSSFGDSRFIVCAAAFSACFFDEAAPIHRVGALGDEAANTRDDRALALHRIVTARALRL